MAKRLRVLQVVLDLEAGGLERLVADMVRRFDPSKFESHVLALRFLGRHGEGLDEFATLHVAGRMERTSMLWPRRLTQIIGEIAPDVVHTHSGVWYKTSKAARAAGVRRLVHTDHGRRVPDPWSDRMADKLASTRTDVVVAVSDPLRDALINRIGIDRTRVRTILNGVDTQHFTPGVPNAELYARLGVDPSTPLIGSLGRFDPVKRYDLMIDAFHRLRASWTSEDGVAPVLVIAGEGPDRPALDRALAATPYATDVKLPGWVSDADDLYRALSVFSLSSSSEGTSMSLLEAMSSGVAPVVTDVGGSRAVLGPSLADRLVPFGQPQSMADAWGGLLRDRKLRGTCSSQARARVESVFSLEAMVRAYEAVYLEIAQ